MLFCFSERNKKSRWRENHAVIQTPEYRNRRVARRNQIGRTTMSQFPASLYNSTNKNRTITVISVYKPTKLRICNQNRHCLLDYMVILINVTTHAKSLKFLCMCTFWTYSSDKTKHILPTYNRGKPTQKIPKLKSTPGSRRSRTRVIGLHGCGWYGGLF